ncbi:hypothetical protein PP178_01625 [Zeaxanthinibacter sp. PT1]|uniref:hypothetical protein n=1 Tax=Zeaxanthinibacter TaxID=561554 RepID=UPI002349AFA9|nr:hypothetical protein [Zeaxanthinibacter sp. PT1]MDC6350237.1 hypothetical protein [Zeaxanthinibacter sp. PT1]
MKLITHRIVLWATIIFVLLMIPAVAGMYSKEVQWDLTDFILMGSALSILGLLYEVIARSATPYYRAAFVVGLLGLFLLFWVNAAVGIIGDEGQDANLLYGAVFVTGLLGSLYTRLNSRGMSRTMIAMGIVQLLTPVVALMVWPPPLISWSPGVFGVFVVSAFFSLLFFLSAYLFHRAGRS